MVLSNTNLSFPMRTSGRFNYIAHVVWTVKYLLIQSAAGIFSLDVCFKIWVHCCRYKEMDG